ncbi:MAG TPA: hypothetical protein VEJ43_00825 [Pseudolabrys sp.]|nr:hypothetical protein [Pseudolabrys sp.]
MREGARIAIGMTFSGLAIAAVVGSSVTNTAANNQRRVLEATVRMERLAKNLERAQKIAPATSLEVAKLIREPSYNCTQVACRGALEMRNQIVRTRLQSMLAVSNAQSPQTTSSLGHSVGR